MKLHFTFATFGAGEAEHITGLSAVRQRDLRRHGILPSKGGGWQQHDLHDLARLLIIRALQDLGIGPSRGVEIANAAAPKIVILVLNRPGAIDDRTNGMLDQIKLDKSRGAFLFEGRRAVRVAGNLGRLVDELPWRSGSRLPQCSGRSAHVGASA